MRNLSEREQLVLRYGVSISAFYRENQNRIFKIPVQGAILCEKMQELDNAVKVIRDILNVGQHNLSQAEIAGIKVLVVIRVELLLRRIREIFEGIIKGESDVCIGIKLYDFHIAYAMTNIFTRLSAIL